jgi:hypothetical protein
LWSCRQLPPGSLFKKVVALVRRSSVSLRGGKPLMEAVLSRFLRRSPEIARRSRNSKTGKVLTYQTRLIGRCQTCFKRKCGLRLIPLSAQNRVAKLNFGGTVLGGCCVKALLAASFTVFFTQGGGSPVVLCLTTNRRGGRQSLTSVSRLTSRIDHRRTARWSRIAGRSHTQNKANKYTHTHTQLTHNKHTRMLSPQQSIVYRTAR